MATSIDTNAGTITIGSIITVRMMDDDIATVRVDDLHENHKDRGPAWGGAILAYAAAPYRVGQGTFGYPYQVVSIKASA